ncbi:hypothetical protein [Hymenobacter chitinivorans]|uniref:Uncharacterized protein n=1 Tax=Hymenobacter chitinivorans DSM 11115 TaxID=1121954 RepID=A0A2M9BQP2_9BACT|nr:hypothetical protein [Hymenobacter chitinivorans]PJJ60248.1 hypothetical protein CLV45_1673 [Hymenobacter chitinivorans DSM 11115]
MAQFVSSRWLGNHWPSIEVEPAETALFQRLLAHLAATYHFPLPPLIDILDGYVADFTLLGSAATLHLDNWTLSLACASEAVRDQVLAELLALPADFFA